MFYAMILLFAFTSEPTPHFFHVYMVDQKGPYADKQKCFHRIGDLLQSANIRWPRNRVVKMDCKTHEEWVKIFGRDLFEEEVEKI